jgi:hypothetical protein
MNLMTSSTAQESNLSLYAADSSYSLVFLHPKCEREMETTAKEEAREERERAA